MKTRPLMYCTVVAVLISIFFIFLYSFFPTWKLYYPLLHSSVEGFGVVLALNVSLLLFLSDKGRDRANPALIQSAFVVMGTLALGHSVVESNQNFVLLHSSSTFAGGLFFALAWLPGRIMKTRGLTALPLYVFILSLAFSIAAFLYPEDLLPMLDQGRFTLYPRLMNFFGGILFFVAAVKFAGDYLKYKRRFEDLLFAHLGILLGIAALLFLFGRMWSWVWWGWHGLRLSAFIIALFFLSQRFSRLQIEAQESVERYRNLVDNLPDLFYIFSNQRGGLYYSRRVEEVLGYTPEELITNPFGWHDSIHADDLPNVDAAVAAYKEGGIYHVEYRIKDRVGNWHWFLDRFVRESQHGDEIVMEGLATDITEKKAAEEALRQEKNFAEKLLNTPRDTVFLFDPVSGKPIRWNDNFALVSGYSHGEIAAMKAPDDFFGKEDLEKSRQAMAEVFASGQGIVELNLITKSGVEIPFEYVANTVEFEGRSFFLSLGRDLTRRKEAELELRRSEKRFRESLDQLLEGCQIIGYDRRYIYINDAAARHGRRPKEDYVGRKMTELYPGIEDTDVFTAIGEVMEGCAPRHLENEFIYPDGTIRWFELSIQSINRGVFVLSIDITDRKNAEAELLQYGHTQAVLLQEVNHRVKNNLAVLISMLRKEYDKADQRGLKEYLPILNDLISRLLGLSTVHSMLSASNWQPVLLSQLCRIMIVEGLKAQRKEILYDITPSEVKVESSQAHHLAMILNELITNSIKYAVVEQRELFISISIEGMGQEVVLTYRDNGPGYSDEAINDNLQSAGIGFDLICGITNKSLAGSVSFRNENGAVAEVKFQKYEAPAEELS